MIPKKIHQIWLSSVDIMKPLHKEWTEQVKAMHPDWEYHLWGGDIVTEDFINKYNLSGVHPALVSDILRVLIIKEHGGIYLDVDCKPVKPLDELLDCDFLAFSDSFSQRGMFVHGAFFGAIPNHPMFDWAISRFESNSKTKLPPQTKYGYPVFNEMVQANIGPGVTVINPELTKTFVIHQFAKSWVGK